MSIIELICLIIINYINNSYEILILKFLLLNMQTFFYWFLSQTSYGFFMSQFFINLINALRPRAVDFSHTKLQTSAINGATNNNSNNLIIENFIKKKVNDLNEIDDSNINEILNDKFDHYDFNYLIKFCLDFFNIYIWFILPFLIIILSFFIIHGLLGLYSAYVDYFQKNMDHMNSYRGFIPLLFILLVLIFIIFSLFFFFISFKTLYILWLLFF